MNPRFFAALAFLLPTIAAVERTEAQSDSGWKAVSSSPSLAIYSRTRKDSSVKELKAVGTIDAPPWVVRNVIDDAENYTQFMPYVVESRVISRKGDGLVGYQRLSPPLVSARDYTVSVQNTAKTDDAGTTYRSAWQTANALGPAERSGTVRVKVTEGQWLMEPADKGTRTRATYQVFTDAGGAIPAFIMNRANTTAIPHLFDSVRKQAREQKYWKNPPAAK